MAKILVVDDEPTIVELLVMSLKDEGYEVLTANDGRAAIEVISEERASLVLLDVMMPKMDGWEVLRRMRGLGLKGSIRVMLLTAKTSESDFLLGWKLGVDNYMTKPFELTELLSQVDQTLKMTSGQIQQKRLRELERANLLTRVESAFGVDF